MPFPDYHVHSNFSCDCHATMAEMCRGAIDNGLSEIGFTEHYDLVPAESCRDWFRLEAWAAELERCRAEFDGRLTLRAGIELGEPHRHQAEAQAMLARYPFDYALGSLHWVGDETIFDPNYFRRTPDEAYRLFYAELERMTRAGGFDVLSHFDVPARTSFNVYGSYDPRPFEPYIRPVLRNCIERGIALDLNTKGLRSKCSVLTPGLDILRWYVEMGGDRATLGSDAHQPKFVGADFAEALGVAKAAGLTHLAYFDKRRVRMAAIA